MSRLFLIFSLIFISLLFIMCSDNSVLQTNENVIPLTHVSNGCYSQKALSKENSEPILEWEFNSNMLALSLLFGTHCSTSCKDSINTEDDLIEIFIADTNEFVARCICRYKEDFYFTIKNQSELNIKFYFKAYSKDEYELLLSKKIKLY